MNVLLRENDEVDAIVTFGQERKLIKKAHFRIKNSRYIYIQLGPSMKSAYRSCLTLVLLIAIGILRAANAQQNGTAASEPGAALGADEVVNKMVERNLERARALIAYRGIRIYRLEYRGFPGSRNAEMIVDVKYRSPGTKEFKVRSENGSKLIIDKVFKRMLQSEEEALTAENQRRIALNPENYRFTLERMETLSTGPSYVLTVVPLNDNKLLYRGRIWVDARDFAVARIDATPAKNPSFWTKETRIEQVYSKVGDFWLPLMNRSNSAIRMGGHAEFTIDYKDYEITAAVPAFESKGAVAGRP